jgi:Phage tail tube protein, GTA-gp10
MSADGSVTFAWGDGEYRFRLGIGELQELQDKCNAGPFEIYQRLATGAWRVNDVREPIRLGLIGGGMDAMRALGKVGKYIAPAQFLPNVVAARRIMLAALFGDPDDILGKATGETAEATPAENSNSRNSSEPAPQWGGQSPMSIAPAFGNSPPPSMAGTDAMAPKSNGPHR